MPELIFATAARAGDPQLFLAGMGAIYLTALVLLAAAGLKFLEHARHPQPLTQSRGHFFSTREMVIVVVLHFPLWLNSIGQLPLPAPFFSIWLAIGAAMMFGAVAWHIAAKIQIRRMWSDGIEIKQQHTLVTTRAYGLARHPMYASLLLWCWGAGAAMANGASLALTTAVLLPLMIVRARDEERALIAVDSDYLLYRRNVPMLTPRLVGAWGLSVRIAAAALFAYGITTAITWATLIPLVALHVYLGFSLKPEKIGFSYLTKSAMMAIVWAGALVWHPVYYVYWVMLAMFVYGLAFNCPCMIIYEKYHGCPCVGFFKRCLIKR